MCRPTALPDRGEGFKWSAPGRVCVSWFRYNTLLPCLVSPQVVHLTRTRISTNFLFHICYLLYKGRGGASELGLQYLPNVGSQWPCDQDWLSWAVLCWLVSRLGTIVLNTRNPVHGIKYLGVVSDVGCV